MKCTSSDVCVDFLSDIHLASADLRNSGNKSFRSQNLSTQFEEENSAVASRSSSASTSISDCQMFTEDRSPSGESLISTINAPATDQLPSEQEGETHSKRETRSRRSCSTVVKPFDSASFSSLKPPKKRTKRLRSIDGQHKKSVSKAVDKKAKKRQLAAVSDDRSSPEEGRLETLKPTRCAEESISDIFKDLRDSIIGQGIWIQCFRCKKWRHLPPGTDPSLQPTPWYCHMNADKQFNDCDVAQELNDESANDLELITAQFSIGSLVWAKTPGFPWWPAMVDLDPDSLEFYWLDKVNQSHLTHYNVTYFDERVTRAWVKVNNVRPFSESRVEEFRLTGKHTSYTRQWKSAIEKAKTALDLSLEERMAKFGFISQVAKDKQATKTAVSEVSPVPSHDSGVGTSSVSPAFNIEKSKSSRLVEDVDVPVRKRSKVGPSSTTKNRKQLVEARAAGEQQKRPSLPVKPPMSLTEWLENGVIY